MLKKRNNLTKCKLMQRFRHFWFASGLVTAFMLTVPVVFAYTAGVEQGQGNLRTAIHLVCLAIRAIAAVYLASAFFRFLMAWINQEAPEQQKSSNYIGIAIILVVASFVVPALKLETVIFNEEGLQLGGESGRIIIHELGRYL